jgi:hypothetical protein
LSGSWGKSAGVSEFPVRDVLPELLSALRDGTRALLVAPPGAGKTTMVAPALLAEPWTNGGQLLLLVPRRLAARAATEFIASQHGEQPGATFGYATRLDSKIGRATRVIAMTHGVFLARIQADPELKGVAAVLFDEVHERSLDNDLALAFSLDAGGGASAGPAHYRHVGDHGRLPLRQAARRPAAYCQRGQSIPAHHPAYRPQCRRPYRAADGRGHPPCANRA